MADRTVIEERWAGRHTVFSQLLRRPYEALLVKIHAEFGAAGFADSYPSWGTNVFHHLREGGLRLTELAGRSHTTKQAMRYTVNQLEAAGYVERVPDPTDGRAKIIRFTERGWQARRVADEIIASVERECVQELGTQKMKEFEALMEEVSGVLEKDRAKG